MFLNVPVKPPGARIGHQLFYQSEKLVVIRAGNLGVNTVLSTKRDAELAAGDPEVARIRKLVQQISIKSASPFGNGKDKRRAVQS
ncbi:hypothetical protein [Polaromonas sp.]|uniref:hypothetical protein n=1 Tax=Polaromonas sp. TaxID=1869339 RepID=UPI0025CF85B5|nr:hypothetical protein [Polaromonas sp.]